MDFHAWTSALLHLPMDWVIVGVFAAVVAADAFRSGARRGIALSLSFPIAFLAYGDLAQAAIIANILKTVSFPFEQNAIVVGLLVILFILFSRMVGSSWEGSGGIVSALLTGSAVAIVAIVFWLQLVPLEALWHFGSQVQTVFGAAYRFWWLIAAYAALAFVRS
jgi:uncharacterized protein (DUF697 family)